MKKLTTIYLIFGIAVLIFAAGFLLSQYTEYKQFQLAQEKAIQDCIDEKVGNATGFTAANAAQKCRDIFTQ